MVPILVIAAWLAVQGIPNSIQAPSGVISGRLTYADGRAAPGVRVGAMLVPEGPPPADGLVLPALYSQAETDQAGRYRLESVPPGRYYVAAGRVDFPTYYPGRTDLAAASAVPVLSGAPVDGIDFVLSGTSVGRADAGGSLGAAASIVAVRVVTENGVPLPLTSPAGPVTIAANPVAPSTVTQEAPVPPGQGRLTVTAGTVISVVVGNGVVMGQVASPPLASAAGSVQKDGTAVLRGNPGDYTIAVENLPDSYEVSAMTAGTLDLRSQLMTVGPGSSSPEILIRLRRKDSESSLRTVTGRVRDGIIGRDWQAQQVTLAGRAASLLSDGSFEFTGLTSGTYVLRALEGPPGDRVAEREVAVEDRDVAADIAFTSKPAYVRVPGRLEIEGAAPRLFSNTRVLASGGGLTPFSVAADGTFTLTLAEGLYRLSIDTAPDLALKSVASGGTVQEIVRVEPEKGPLGPELRVVLAPRPRMRVRGRVTGVPAARPIEGAEIALTGGAEGYRGEVRADGTFEIEGVLPGSYALKIELQWFTYAARPLVVTDSDLSLELQSEPD